MRVVQPASDRRWRLPDSDDARRGHVSGRAAGGAVRAARIERLGLLAVSLILLPGLWLAYVGQTQGLVDCANGVPSTGSAQPVTRCPINLNALRNGRGLLPALTMIEPTERNVVAAALFERVAAGAGQPRLEHVGGLAGVTLPAAVVRRDKRLVSLNAQLLERPDATAVRVLSATNLAELKPNVIVRTLDQYQRRVFTFVAVFMLAFWLAHAVRARRGTTGDAVLLPVVQLLTGLGLMTLLAMRDPLRDMVIAEPMAIAIAAGCALWTIVSFIDFESPRLRRAVLPPLSVAVLLALALLVFGSGPGGSGAKVNLLGVQPVEAIRLLVAFALAAYFARRWSFLREFSEGMGPSASVQRRVQLPRWKDVRPLAITIATLLAFFFLQKDLGPALVLSCVFLGLYGLSRGRAPLVAAGFAVLAAGFTAGYALGVPATVTRRVAIWLDPWDNALPGGDQIAHSLWAMSSGGAWGLGPGVGDPQLIPAGHTDLVVAAVGEELGYVGVVCVLALFALLVWRTLRIARRAPGDYTLFLTAGLTLTLAAQAIVIVGGTLGLLPLAGVVTPFLSYGRSAMLSNFAAVAVCAAVARRAGPPREAFAAPVRAVGWTLAVLIAALAWRVTLVQVVRGDGVASRANLTQQADGGYRYQYNPRLVAAARQLERGTIYDRNGLPLATNRPERITAEAARFHQLGLNVSCPNGERCYPLGGLAFHLIGDAERQINWAARNTSFAEQDFDAQLKGYDDHPRTVQVTHPGDGRTFAAVRRDYSELLPLVRHRGNPQHEAVRRLVTRNRDLTLTVDARLQVSLARALRARALATGSGRGAAVVIDPASGDLLASASYPWPEPRELSGDTPPVPTHLLDRARYGLYPPGSTFKLVTAVAALRSQSEAERTTFDCVRLSDGRVGGRMAGSGAVIRDDPQDRSPHGRLDLHRALVVSCNAYFASLAQRLGSKALAETAAAAQIAVAPPPAETNLRRTLPFAGYGQGHVVASPLRMARATAALASDGVLRDVQVVPRGEAVQAADVQWISESGAEQLRRDMRAVVTSGTGRALAGHPVAIAGKTGTAEVDGAPSHAWFVGFAPFDEPRIAFAVVLENAGYGGRVAAPLAGDLVTAAQERGLFK